MHDYCYKSRRYRCLCSAFSTATTAVVHSLSFGGSVVWPSVSLCPTPSCHVAAAVAAWLLWWWCCCCCRLLLSLTFTMMSAVKKQDSCLRSVVHISFYQVRNTPLAIVRSFRLLMALPSVRHRHALPLLRLLLSSVV